MSIDCSLVNSKLCFKCSNFIAQLPILLSLLACRVADAVLRFVLGWKRRSHLHSQGCSSICRVCLYAASVPAALEDNQMQRIIS